MDRLQEFMQRPYSLIHSTNSLELVELGIKVKLEDGLDSAISKLNQKKEEYFNNMLEHGADHLIPTPLIWKNNFFLTGNLQLKNWVIKCLVASLFFVVSVLICFSFIRSSLNRSIEKLDEVLNPIMQDESKKVTILKKNLEKYRPYIKEIVKVMEEEGKN